MQVHRQQTTMLKEADIDRHWQLVDAKDQVLGRLASRIARQLIGKDKATYTPHLDGGDYVVVINAAQVVLTRNKADQKVYYRHSQRPGSLKVIPFRKMLATHPTRVIEKAVYNMLPKNKLRQSRMNRLKVYAGAEHPHTSQLGSREE